ncbi:MAG: LysM peptidoglycan-binding domain-containing protein [Candidatus Competibacteraceae bacterium]|nr:LysM peptidoglycan-binding domain-containing protein [Candidatus Competibacteraceae bacterium]
MVNRIIDTTIIISLLITVAGGCANVPQRGGQVSESYYIVQKGDTLGEIAQRMTGSSNNWRALARYNGITNPRRLEVGQQLTIPADLSMIEPRSAASTSSGRSTGRESFGGNSGGSSTGSSGFTGLSTQAEGAVIVGVLGAVAGALLCDKKNRVECAAAGAAIGGVGGYVIGNEIAKRQKRYASAEAFYDAQIRKTAQLNQSLSRQNRNLRKSIQADQRRVNTLVAQYRSGRTKKSSLNALRRDIERKHNQSSKQLAEAKKEYEINNELLKTMQNSGQAKRIADLRNENNELRNRIVALEDMSDDLVKITAAVGEFR